jgi:hypothetical protein
MCVFAGFERKCNICKKTITSTTQKGVNNNFHGHLKVHNLSAKEYKALSNPVAQPPVPPPFVPQPLMSQPLAPQYQEEPGYGAEGGFDDRGADDERYQDVPDAVNDPTLVPLEVALCDPDTRAVLYGVETLWTAGSVRARAQIKPKSQVTMIGQGARVLKELAIVEGKPLPPRVHKLKVGATSRQINTFALQVVEAIKDLVTADRWASRLLNKPVQSMAVALHMLHRLFHWATTKYEQYLVSWVGVGG